MRRFFRSDAVWLLLPYLAIIVIGVWGYSSLRHQSEDNHRALVVLCAVKVDLGHRIANTERVLEENPRGTATSTPEDLQQRIAQSQNTYDAINAQLPRCEGEG